MCGYVGHRKTEGRASVVSMLAGELCGAVLRVGYKDDRVRAAMAGWLCDEPLCVKSRIS